MKKTIITILVSSFSIVCFSQFSCLEDGMIFTRQSQIDSIPILYPDCIFIQGDIEIFGDDITNLAGFVKIKKGKEFRISKCNNLYSFSGLDSLNSLTGRFVLDSLPNIKNFEGLGKLRQLQDGFFVIGLSGLTSFSGLNSIRYIDRLNVWDCDSLFSLSGIDSLKGASSILLTHNDQLAWLNGLENITELTSLTVVANDTLISLGGLHNLKSIRDNLKISANNNLRNFIGLMALEEIGQDLIIRNNLRFHSGEYLTKVKKIGRDFIYDNNDASTIPVSFQFDTIGRDLIIQENDNIESLHGFDSIKVVQGALVIHDNQNLLTIDDLENLSFDHVTSLQITNCPRLDYCSLDNICSYLSQVSNPSAIFNNIRDCDTREDITALCQTTSLSNPDYSHEITIYPNPVTDKLFIDTTKKVLYTIYNSNGQAVLKDIDANTFVDVSLLDSGIYFISTPSRVSVTKKFIKL